MKNLRRVLVTLALMFIAISAMAQDVCWSHSLREEGGENYTLIIEAKIAEGAHIYGVTPNDNCFPTVIKFSPSEGATLEGKVKVVTPPTVVDGIEKLKKRAIFEQRLTAKEGASVKTTIEYMACTDMGCGLPSEESFTCNIGTSAAPAEAPNEEIKSSEDFTDTESIWTLIIEAVLWGFAALFTPCVFPMVPMTVSFFTKSSKSAARGRINASLYGLFIVLLYTIPVVAIVAVAQLIGGIDGYQGMITEFSRWWVPNVIFFIIFMVFAASFFGAFDITMPSKLINKSDQQSDKGGVLGIFFMAFTLVLVSFSCTGPIVGSVLANSFSGKAIWAPIITIFVFSATFALPFTLFAFFPSLLQKLPKSGGWLNSVKVVLGFIEVALGFKFLQIADQSQQWGLLDREIYLAIWIVVFSLLGLYLLGKIRFAHDDEVKHIGVGRLALAIGVFTFVVYMIPGMWGAPLKALSGYLPDIKTQEFVLPMHTQTQTQTHTNTKFTDIEEAQAYAKQVGKPLFIDITGNTCANCREMEAQVLSNATVQQILHDEYVEVMLYTDDPNELPKEKWFTTKEGKVLKEIGKKNTYFAESHNISYLPCYLLQDADGKALTAPRSYNTDVEAFIEFLRKGVQEYKKE